METVAGLVLIVTGAICIAQAVGLYRLQQRVERINAKHATALMVLKTVKERLETWPFDDVDTCMCGDAIQSHNPHHSNHAPVSCAAYSRNETVSYINNSVKDFNRE